MRLEIDGRKIESPTFALTNVEGGTSSHAISATALVHALANGPRNLHVRGVGVDDVVVFT